MINFFLHVQIFHPFEYFRISVKPNIKPTLGGVLAVTTFFTDTLQEQFCL